MKKILLLQAIMEMIAGVIFVFRPDLILMTSGQGANTLLIAKLYALLAFTFGAICFFLHTIFEYNSIFKKIVMVIMAFHLMIALQLYSGFNQGLVLTIVPFGVHILLAVLFGIVYMREVNSFQE